MKKILIFSLIAASFWCCSPGKSPENLPSVIPVPVKTEMKSGYFRFNGKTEIVINTEDSDMRSVAELLADKLSIITGKPLKISYSTRKQPGNSVFLKLDPYMTTGLGKEGYRLSVKSSGIEIVASKPAGLFYGIQTVYQLLPAEIYNPDQLSSDHKADLQVPCCEIEDRPEFSWRGMHLDVSRHFFPKEFVKKYIDLIAMHKMNTFHWHLTDDNGWRIAIEKYPELTKISAWRADREGIPWNERAPQRDGEPATYGGFYTREDIREIVEYAAKRFVTIIPEIEMPGHSAEVFAAYPEYSCSGKRIPVQTGSYWPNEDIFCAGKDETFRFLENVLDEVSEMFPSEYIHIGGDEADKTAWKSCPACQTRIRKEGLKNVDELQSYFVKRIEKYLTSKGKKMIGWDEILEGGLAPEATVMSWRGFDGGIEAVRQGHQVIMCPVSYCYFDYYQAAPEFQPHAAGGLITVKKVYSFRPVPSGLSPEEGKLILGGQGNLWTEHISEPYYAEYMALPRMTALAEVLWSPEDKLIWSDFRERLQEQFKRFDILGVNYSKGSGKVEVKPLFNTDDKPYSLKLETEMPGTGIYYTLDGYVPSQQSYIYKKPIEITHDVVLKTVAYKDDKQLEAYAEYKIDYHRAVGKNVVYRNKYSELYPGTGSSPLTDGLRASLNFNDGFWQGFYGKNMDVVVELGEEMVISSISSAFLLDQKRWIFIPDKVNYYFSLDGENFHLIAGTTHKIPLDDNRSLTNDFTIKLKQPIKARSIRVEAVNIGQCPDWHPGKGKKAWIFADEILIN